MFILVAYDVSTVDANAANRLRHVAKICKNYGQRVQNSVFECIVDFKEYESLKIQLFKIANPETDSIRIYNLGKNDKGKIEKYGKEVAIDVQEPIIV